MTSSDSRTSELSGTLQIASADRYPDCRASRSAASVSAVSPDCEIVTNSEFAGTRRVAIAVFAGDFDGARNLADLLDEVTRDQPA